MNMGGSLANTLVSSVTGAGLDIRTIVVGLKTVEVLLQMPARTIANHLKESVRELLEVPLKYRTEEPPTSL